MGYRLLDWAAVEADVKATLGTPDEPFEGKVPLPKLEDAIKALIEKDRKAGRKLHYVFDSFPLHANAQDFATFTQSKLGSPGPDYIFDIREGGVTAAAAAARFQKRLEAEALSEEQQAEFKA